MSIDKILVIIAGFVVMVFIYWFFLLKKSKKGEQVEGEIDIIVQGGYTPDTVIVPIGKKVKINFTRKDKSSCLEEVVIPDFKIRKYLPVDEKVSIEIMAETAGEFGFACGMNMFHGKIIAK